MKYLFVDIAAVNRAPYAARWLNDYLYTHDMDGGASCAGIGLVRRKRHRLSETIIENTDIILAMDRVIEREIKDRYPAACGKVVDIDVPDKFNHNKKDGVLPKDITQEELKEYMRTNEFGHKAMDMYLEMTLVPLFRA